MIRFELLNQMPPDNRCGHGMVCTAANRRDGVPVIAGYRPQAFAGQAGQQAPGDFMGTDELKRKGFRSFAFRVQVPEKGSFKTGVMNHGGTAHQLIGSGNSACGSNDLLPDVGR